MSIRRYSIRTHPPELGYTEIANCDGEYVRVSDHLRVVREAREEAWEEAISWVTTQSLKGQIQKHSLKALAAYLASKEGT